MAKSKCWTEKFISVKEFNEILDDVKLFRNIKYENAEKIYLHTKNWSGFKRDAYIWETVKGSVHIAYRVGGVSFNYTTTRIGDDEEKAGKQVVSGGRAWVAAKKINPELKPVRPDLKKRIGMVSGMLYYNPKHQMEWNNAWHYDMNSAFANIMMHYDFPDVENDLGIGEVEKGQIGFNIDFTELRFEGEYAIFRYNLIPSIHKKFAVTEFEKIKKLRAQGKKSEAKKYKSMLTNFIGYMIYARPIDRQYIILMSNHIMQQYIDALGDAVLHCNTDALVVTKPIDDMLVIGPECGQFKVEHRDVPFEYYQYNYHWKEELPSIRGVAKHLLTKDDHAWSKIEYNYKYTLDRENVRLVENEQEDE